MGNLGPGDKPKVVRKRAARAKRKPAPPAAAIPGLGAVARPDRPARVPPRPTARARRAQRQTEHAQPLSPTPVKPTNVDAPRPKLVARPLQAKPPKGIKAGKPVKDAKQARGVAVAAYDQLSGDAKRGHLAGAQKRVRQGKATDTDVAILHAHDTRVKGKQNVVKAVKAYNALAGTQVGGTGKGLHLDPGTTVRGGNLYDPSGNKLRKVGATEAQVRKQGTVANLPSVGKIVGAVGPLATKGLDTTPLPKVIKNIPKDAAELAVTAPTSLTKLAVTAATHPKKVPGMLAAPYKELAKDPKEFISEHPVSTALMLEPGRRIPGRVAGKVLRSAGKQTLEREAATLPSTALRETREGSRSAGRRAVQTRVDRRAQKRGETPKVTSHQLNRRVDESFAGGQQYADRVSNAVMRKAKEHAKTLPKNERAQHLEESQTAARGAGSNLSQRRFAEEFGATAHVENGRIVENPKAAEGHLHENVEDARAVAEHLNKQSPTIKRGHGNVLSGDPVGRLYAKDEVPVEFVVRKVGQDKHVVVPFQAADRLRHHQAVGTSKSTGAKILRQTRGMFTRAVLPYRPTWLSGQGIEGAVRSAVDGAGPTSYLRTKRVVKAMESQKPGSGKALLERAAPGGLVGQAGMDLTRKTLHEEFPESNVARALTDIGRTPGVKQVRQLHHATSKFVFEKMNAKVLEGVPQTAMLGRALKRSPLMDRSMIGLTNKAVEEAARGLQETHTQVAAARSVQRSYGKYTAYSPKMRELIAHWTPFIPWYLSTAKFMLSVLPKDHPMAAALVADTSAATEDWRKAQGLSLRYPEHRLPSFMLGGYPTQGGKNLVRIGHYTPAGIGSEFTDAVSGLALPQFQGFAKALMGLDWKGDPLKHKDGSKFNQGEQWVYALTQLAEAMVPLAGQASQVAGAEDKGAEAKKLLRPVSMTPLHREKDSGGTQITPVKVKPVKLKSIRVKPVQTGG